MISIMIENPDILLSLINTKLRDQYSSLADLCDDLDYDLDRVIEILGNHGYHYDQSANQFKAND